MSSLKSAKPANVKSAYNFFTSMMHEEFKEMFPGCSVDFIDFQKRCAAKWKTLTADEKLPFENLATLDKQRFQQEMALFPLLPQVPQDDGKRKRKKKDPNEPKKPMTAFILFSNERRAALKEQQPSLSLGEVAKHLGQLWREASAEQKQPYEEASTREKEKYAIAMEAYRRGETLPKENAMPPSKMAKTMTSIVNGGFQTVVKRPVHTIATTATTSAAGQKPNSVPAFDKLDQFVTKSQIVDLNADQGSSGLQVPKQDEEDDGWSDEEMQAVDEGEGDKEAGDKEAGDKEAGDKEAGDKEAGDKEAGDKEAGDKEAGEKEAGDEEEEKEENEERKDIYDNATATGCSSEVEDSAVSSPGPSSSTLHPDHFDQLDECARDAAPEHFGRYDAGEESEGEPSANTVVEPNSLAGKPAAEATPDADGDSDFDGFDQLDSLI